MTKKIKIKDVFSGFDVPSVTYVAQENGKYEINLREGIEESGTLCLLTGSSKSGKTTLYKRVFSLMNKEPLIIRCSKSIEVDEFWKSPLEKVDFDRLTKVEDTNSREVSAEGGIEGKIGWAWLAELIGKVSLGVRSSHSETEIREKIVSKPSPSHLIPLLKYSNAVLVVEDFHYLKEDVQKVIFQQWKSFTDEQVSVLVVGTTHHGVDLAYANPDLIGRIQHIDLGRWSTDDLCQIASKGFLKLRIYVSTPIIKLIAEESAGLPIITQQTCAQLFFGKQIFELIPGTSISFIKQDLFDALNNIANKKYKQFESWYSRLTMGPRKNARKYNTYEILLLIFAMDPLRFELKRYEIDERIKRLKLAPEKHPPAASINSTLSALKRFQENNGFKLLEWSKRDQAIYILEPAFLFFVRWREPRTSVPDLADLIGDILPALSDLVKAILKDASRDK